MAKKPARSASKVWVPPEFAVSLPVRPRLQVLPLNELPWELFQRLCARLAQRSGDVEFSQEYGIPGQEQEGIDVYVRRRSTGRYSVWQCKRYQAVSASVIESAVDEFLGGEWLTKTDEFVLCVSARTEERDLADEIESQAQRLREHGVAFLPLGIVQLSERLKDRPDLVEDIFGSREWVREFCGIEAAERLGHRALSPEQVSQLRGLLRRCYARHFETADPGLPSLTGAISRGPQPLPLAERFILPDVLEPRQITQTQTPSADPPPRSADTGIPPSLPVPSPPPGGPVSGRMVTFTTDVRRPALDWLVEGELSVVIGDPGIGKSSLLRYLLLDLLSLEPRHEVLAIKWGTRLPVWVPFPMWTRMVAESESA